MCADLKPDSRHAGTKYGKLGSVGYRPNVLLLPSMQLRRRSKRHYQGWESMQIALCGYTGMRRTWAQWGVGRTSRSCRTCKSRGSSKNGHAPREVGLGGVQAEGFAAAAHVGRRRRAAHGRRKGHEAPVAVLPHAAVGHVARRQRLRRLGHHLEQRPPCTRRCPTASPQLPPLTPIFVRTDRKQTRNNACHTWCYTRLEVNRSSYSTCTLKAAACLQRSLLRYSIRYEGVLHS